MKNWFLSLDERERFFVIVAAAVLALAVFYLAIWMPLDRGQSSTANSVSGWRNSIAELRLLQGELQSAELGQSEVAGLDQSLVVIIDETLRNRGLYDSLQRSQPTGPAGIRVEFENVAFDQLVLWLGDLSSRYALQVQAANVSNASRDHDGRVNATITLER
jgi:general secretion pathway protein M